MELRRKIKEHFRWNVFIFEETSRPHPPREVYMAGIQDSLIFIGIYGSEYGWIDETNDMTISGIHDEWRLASQHQLLRHAFIQNTDEKDEKLKILVEEIQEEITTCDFSTGEELYEKVILALDILKNEYIYGEKKTDIKDLPDYLKLLKDKYENKYVLKTSFYEEHLKPTVESKSKIYLCGQMGTGKTINLIQISEKYHTIYISLRNHSLSYVLTYVLIHLLHKFHLGEMQGTSIDELQLNIERVLRHNEVLLIIDDIDQNEDAARYLLGINEGRSKIIYSGRRNIKDIGLATIKCKGFTDDESDQYLRRIVPNIPIDKRTDAIEKSSGNPLYLECFSLRSDQSPLDSLEDYHDIIFDSLATGPKEILAVLSLCETVLTLEKLANIISLYRSNHVSPISLQEELVTIEHLLFLSEGIVEIFYAAFKEHIYKKINSAGIAPSVHRVISELYTESYDHCFRVYHLACAGEQKDIYDDLPNAELMAYQRGYINIARYLFARDVKLSRSHNDAFRLGYALHHISMIKKDCHGDLAGLNTSRLAKKFFEISNNSNWAIFNESVIATYLVNLGRGAEALDVLKRAIAYFQQHAMLHLEAVARTNLAFVYNKLGYINELEKECQLANQLHEKLGDINGVVSCLININCVYLARGDASNILSTCRKIQKYAKELDSPRIEAAAQNGLTAYYRRKDQYDKAEQSAKKSIALAESLNIKDLIAINYGNLGNVYRDQEKYQDAKECYLVVERIGLEYHSMHNIAYSKARLAEIAEDEGDGDLALELSDEAIELWDKLGNVYQGAVEMRKKAHRILTFKDLKWNEAIEIHENASHKFFSAGLYKDYFDSIFILVDLFLNRKNRYDAARVFKQGIKDYSNIGEVDYVNAMLREISRWDAKSLAYLDIMEIAKDSIKCISSVLSKGQLFDVVRILTSIAKVYSDEMEQLYSLLTSTLVVLYKEEKHLHYITAIAILIEQFSPNVSDKFLTSMLREISSIDNSIFYRNESWLDDQWFLAFSFDNSPMVEMRSGKSISERIFTSVCILLIYRQKQSLEKLISEYGWKRIGLVWQTLNSHECNKHDIPTPNFDENYPAVFPEYVKDEYRDENRYHPVIVNGDYLNYANHISFPDNRSIIMINLCLVTELIKHFTKNISPEKKLKKYRRSTTVEIFDVKYDSSAT
jgi:tetratricopeptide (TPR) repeat protein